MSMMAVGGAAALVIVVVACVMLWRRQAVLNTKMSMLADILEPLVARSIPASAPSQLPQSGSSVSRPAQVRMTTRPTGPSASTFFQPPTSAPRPAGGRYETTPYHPPGVRSPTPTPAKTVAATAPVTHRAPSPAKAAPVTVDATPESVTLHAPVTADAAPEPVTRHASVTVDAAPEPVTLVVEADGGDDDLSDCAQPIWEDPRTRPMFATMFTASHIKAAMHATSTGSATGPTIVELPDDDDACSEPP